MRIGLNSPFRNQFTIARQYGAEAQPVQRGGQTGSGAGDDLRDLHANVLALRSAISGLGNAAGAASTISTSKVGVLETVTDAVATGRKLDLSRVETHTQLEGQQIESTRERKAEVGKWQEGSKAKVKIVDGVDQLREAGTGELQIEVTEGKDDRSVFLVWDGDELIDAVAAPKDLGKNEKMTLAFDNGLELELKGDVKKGDSFTFDPGGIEEFDPSHALDGLGVKKGELQINGHEIRVDKKDTLHDVLKKIDESGAGVMSSFDAETKQITLQAKEAGSSGEIEFGKDKTGFLDAVGLKKGTLTQGTDDELETQMSKVDEFSRVKSGSFRINDAEIEVDVKRDSLYDVVNRINDSDSGAIASVDEQTGQVKIRSAQKDQVLEIEAGKGGALAALGIESGKYGETVRTEKTVDREDVDPKAVKAFKEQAKEVQSAFQRVMKGIEKLGAESRDGKRYADALRTAAQNQFGEKDGDRFHTGLGFTLDLGEGGKGVEFKFGSGEGSIHETFHDSSDRKQLVEMLNGATEAQQGFLGRLDEALKNMDGSLRRSNGSTGIRLRGTA